MLPAPYTWHNDETGKNRLTFHYGWVATVESDGTTRVCGWGVEHQVKAASAAQGRRFVERWIKARTGMPGMGRLHRRSASSSAEAL
jgi:hypothetical protein